MWSPELTEEELNWLLLYNFDPKLQTELRERYVRGDLSKESNQLTGRVEVPPASSVENLPSSGSLREQEAIEAGTEALTQRKAALLVLNGGMATRFGGAVKGIIPVVGSLSFLALKLTAARLLCEQFQTELPVYLMNSIATHEITLDHLRDNDYFGYPPRLVIPFLQNTLLRLSTDGEMVRLPDGSVTPYGPGHGDVAEAVARDPLPDMKARGVEVLYMSNVDNVLATPDPAIFGMHLLRGAEMTIEVVPNVGSDVGGAPAVVDGKMQIVEAFRLPQHFPMGRLTDFNTNTFCFDPQSLDRRFPLSWFVVTKTARGRDVIQFERLAGQLSEYLSTHTLRVDRSGPGSRFCPIKDRNTLQRERNRIVGTLTQRGFLPTESEYH
jgi:UTP--glucose-1-phosphate uridylyltransferase